MDTINIFLSTMETLAVGLNILTIYLMRRMGLKEVDMWLGVTMAVCDLVISGFKIIELPLYLFVEEASTLLNSNIVIPMSGLIVFLVAGSITSVAYLSIIRYLAICREYPLEKLDVAKHIYLLHMTIIFSILLLCYLDHGFVLMPNGNYYYPDFSTTNPYGFIANLILALNIAFAFLAFNLSYILITRKYLYQLSTVNSFYGQNESYTATGEKFKIVLKMIIMLLLYNLTVIPLLSVGLIELITVQQRTIVADAVANSGITCITFVNPAMLITMHCDTWREFQKLFAPAKQSPPHLTLDDVESNHTSKLTCQPAYIPNSAL